VVVSGSLERAFFGACTDESGRARTEESMSWHTKHYGLFEVGQERVVCARRGGGFCQVREENKTARLVVRGFREQAHAHEQPPHEPFCGWDNWGDTRDSPEKREAAAGYRRQVVYMPWFDDRECVVWRGARACSCHMCAMRTAVSCPLQ
jgi:hypothetical protein